MTKDFLSEMEAEAASLPVAEKPEASLHVVQNMAQKAVKLQREIDEYEEKTKKLKTELYELRTKSLPTDMLELKLPLLEIDGYKVECKPYYKANIAAEDPEEKRARAFAFVEENDGGGIINNTVTVAFPKENYDEAQKFFTEVRTRFDNQREIEVVLEKKVPWNRLTKWLKEFVERKPLPGETKPPIPLDDLNATVGHIVEVKKSRRD